MSSGEHLTRDDCRRLFFDLGLTYDGLEDSDIAALQLMLSATMRQRRKKPAGSYHKTWSMSKKIVVKHYSHGVFREAYLKCLIGGSERECVSFNPGGWIGFCGDFDDANAAPILETFASWCYLMAYARDARQQAQAKSIVELYAANAELRILARDMHQQIKYDDTAFRNLRERGYVTDDYDGALGVEDMAAGFESRMDLLGIDIDIINTKEDR